jgi:hypothetical protein
MPRIDRELIARLAKDELFTRFVQYLEQRDSELKKRFRYEENKTRIRWLQGKIQMLNELIELTKPLSSNKEDISE